MFLILLAFILHQLPLTQATELVIGKYGLGIADSDTLTNHYSLGNQDVWGNLLLYQVGGISEGRSSVFAAASGGIHVDLPLVYVEELLGLAVVSCPNSTSTYPGLTNETIIGLRGSRIYMVGIGYKHFSKDQRHVVLIHIQIPL